MTNVRCAEAGVLPGDIGEGERRQHHWVVLYDILFIVQTRVGRGTSTSYLFS